PELDLLVISVKLLVICAEYYYRAKSSITGKATYF
ncbi:MAG: hypothetical protein ACI8XC_001741, partial [Gammaproteobacteria bacterium]